MGQQHVRVGAPGSQNGRGIALSDVFGPVTFRHIDALGPATGWRCWEVGAGVDPVLVADLLGHAGLDTLRVYTQPDDSDRERALALLTTDA